MRVLLVNKFNYPRGGADKYFLWLQRSLASRGHEVAIFAMQHPKNEPSPWGKHFVSRASANQPGFKEKLRAAGRTLYSFEARHKFSRLIDDFKPDIVHCHNIYHHLSPSILGAAAKRGVPIVFHLHDYKLISPNYRLYSHDQIDESGLGKWGALRSLARNSLESWPRSILASLETLLHRDLLATYRRHIDLLIAPSHFIEQKFVAAGWPQEKIRHLLNPIPDFPKSQEEIGNDGRFLYLGRFASEKGIGDLLEAALLAEARLTLIGSGPLEEPLRQRYQADAEHFHFLGQKAENELLPYLKRASAIVIPSRWYENMPLVLLEALALGKIVIAAETGGLPELISHGRNGFLYPAGNRERLATLMRQVSDMTALERVEMEAAARASVQHLKADNHLKKLELIYQEAHKMRKKS